MSDERNDAERDDDKPVTEETAVKPEATDAEEDLLDDDDAEIANLIADDDDDEPAGIPDAVYVQYGAHNMDTNGNAIGRTIAAVRKYYTEPLNMNGREAVRVNGEQAKDSYKIVAGDKIEFVRESGRKG